MEAVYMRNVGGAEVTPQQPSSDGSSSSPAGAQGGIINGANNINVSPSGANNNFSPTNNNFPPTTNNNVPNNNPDDPRNWNTGPIYSAPNWVYPDMAPGLPITVNDSKNSMFVVRRGATPGHLIDPTIMSPQTSQQNFVHNLSQYLTMQKQKPAKLTIYGEMGCGSFHQFAKRVLNPLTYLQGPEAQELREGIYVDLVLWGNSYYDNVEACRMAFNYEGGYAKQGYSDNYRRCWASYCGLRGVETMSGKSFTKFSSFPANIGSGTTPTTGVVAPCNNSNNSLGFLEESIEEDIGKKKATTDKESIIGKKKKQLL